MGVYSSADKAINTMIANSDYGDMIELQSMINEMSVDRHMFGYKANWMIEEHYIDERLKIKLNGSICSSI